MAFEVLIYCFQCLFARFYSHFVQNFQFRKSIFQMSFVDFVSMLMSERENAIECAFLSAPHDFES